MPKFKYKKVTKGNVVMQGTISAAFKRRAGASIKKDGSTVLWLERERDQLLRKEISIPGFNKFSKLERIIFFRNLATMLGVGVSISKALRTLQEQARKRAIRNILGDIVHDVENGRPLSSAMEKFPAHFSDYIVETIRVGEISGRLSETLERIALTLERDYEISRKVISAIAYPVVVIFVMVFVVTGLIVYVLPKISELFVDLHSEPPLLTRVLLGLGRFIGEYPWHLAGGILLLFLAVALFVRTRRGKYIFHYAILRLPFFGELIKEFNLIRFFRALDALFGSGISLVKSVEVGGKTLKNVVYKRAVSSMKPVLLHGIHLTDALKSHPSLFPLQVQRIIEVGEETGKIDETFTHLTNYYERMVNHKIQIMNTMIEPVLMLVVGVIVGGIALSVFLPIYQVANVL